MMIKMLTDCGIPDYFFTRAVKQIKIQIFIVKMEKKECISYLLPLLKHTFPAPRLLSLPSEVTSSTLFDMTFNLPQK